MHRTGTPAWTDEREPTMAEQDPRQRRSEGTVEVAGRIVSVKLIVAALLLAGITFFVVQNTEQVAVTWLFFAFETPLWALTLVLFGAGIVMGWALHLRRTRRRTRG